MPTGRSINHWTLIIMLLAAIIITGSIITWTKYSRSQPIEISIVPGQELQGQIYVGGAVNNPGIYPLKSRDNVEAIIQAAGGTTDSADLSQLTLHIPTAETEVLPQKVNLNRAETWLLQALPGIGEVRAQAIIDYRQQNVPFHNTYELTAVEGIGTATYERLKDLITVAD